MDDFQIDLDRTCFVILANPAQRIGPMRLRRALRHVVDHRPPAEEVSIEFVDGTRLDELEIGAIYVMASLATLSPSVLKRRTASLQP